MSMGAGDRRRFMVANARKLASLASDVISERMSRLRRHETKVAQFPTPTAVVPLSSASPMWDSNSLPPVSTTRSGLESPRDTDQEGFPIATPTEDTMSSVASDIVAEMNAARRCLVSGGLTGSLDLPHFVGSPSECDSSCDSLDEPGARRGLVRQDSFDILEQLRSGGASQR
mmetsp:Transcript_105913/g.242510  ORF Transcript_105913/g.242510 Transcript_105913/m.242510 type:complete len:172 (+) Transcript_105913:27-542(+)